MYTLVEKLRDTHALSAEEYNALLTTTDAQVLDFLREQAVAVRQKHYGNTVFVRGLIEFTNYCKNDCYYCGIRCSNRRAERYRLTEQQILDCCKEGYALGYRTFVLQGGEDPAYTPARMEKLVADIKNAHPDCAVTLSVGEQDTDTYRRWREAGADRYLLRHETADADHYGKLHPARLTLENRKRCLWDLKELGYQVGCGFMVGSPFQKIEHLVKDLQFLSELQPDMVGIGPFIPHKDTPFGNETAGSVEMTLRLLSIIRLLLPRVLLPATTALGTLRDDGRENGILSGANVCMPNLSPADVRKKYTLYDNKRAFGSEAAEEIDALKKRMTAIGYDVVVDRGDRKEI